MGGLPTRVASTRPLSLIERGTIVTPHRVIERGSIHIRDGKVVEVEADSPEYFTRNVSSDSLSAENKIAIPGMIDIHTHGLYGVSALDGRIDSVKKMSALFPRHGVTAFLPTTAAEPQQILLSAAKAVAELTEGGATASGAEVLGLNLEGPYISKAKLGAQPNNFVRDPNYDEFNQLYDESRSTVKLITIAPELPRALEFIREVKAKGVTVAAGHSNATYEEMVAAIDAGVTHASHTFNAMREFKHRDPGILAAILTRDDVTAELIADNVHVHEGAMRLLIKAKGASNIVLVSDSMPPAGMPDGKYEFMGFKIELKNGVITLPTGQLAGSATTLDRSLRVAVNNSGVSLQDAVKMATLNPAKVVKADGKKGSIEAGKDADIVLLNKQDLSVCCTIIGGRVVHCQPQFGELSKRKSMLLE